MSTSKEICKFSVSSEKHRGLEQMHDVHQTVHSCTQHSGKHMHVHLLNLHMITCRCFLPFTCWCSLPLLRAISQINTNSLAHFDTSATVIGIKRIMIWRKPIILYFLLCWTHLGDNSRGQCWVSVWSKRRKRQTHTLNQNVVILTEMVWKWANSCVLC